MSVSQKYLNNQSKWKNKKVEWSAWECHWKKIVRQLRPSYNHTTTNVVDE